jgi:CubicO group peptidase (beta-lactamase class C family)
MGDVLLFGRAALILDEKAPLAPAFRMAQQPWRESKIGKNSFVGFFWRRMASPNKGNTLIWHNGGTGGYRSFLGVIPEKKLVVALLTNTARSVDEAAVEIIKYLEQQGSE